MLRSFSKLLPSVVQCQRHFGKTFHSPVAAPVQWARAVHSSGCLSILNKEVKNKTKTYERSQADKEDQIPTSMEDVEEVDTVGLTEAGITIPTLETHAMLIDGIRYDELPIIYIRSSPNNTIITVTDHTGLKVITGTSCGKEGFRNAKKSTTVAAQATGMSAGKVMIKRGVKNARVLVKGIGVGRLPSITGVAQAGVNIISITDNTPISKWLRPRKARRL